MVVFIIMKPYIFLERVDSFYKNKTGYLLRDSWWFFFIRIKNNIFLEGERELVVFIRIKQDIFLEIVGGFY